MSVANYNSICLKPLYVSLFQNTMHYPDAYTLKTVGPAVDKVAERSLAWLR